MAVTTTNTPGAIGRTTYYTSNIFWIEIDGLLEATFTDCTGLAAETEVYEYKEGGQNAFVHKLPVRTKFTNLTLKRGMTMSSTFWNWYQSTVNGQIEKRNISIILYSPDEPGVVVKRWEVSAAYPIKWTGPELKAGSSGYAIETLELAYTRFTLA
jgi:phage tail-like protein